MPALLVSRPAQTCSDPSLCSSGIPPWVLDAPWSLPSLDLRYLGWCHQDSCGRALETLKNIFSRLDQMWSWQSCNLSFFYFKTLARKLTGSVWSQIYSPPNISNIYSSRTQVSDYKMQPFFKNLDFTKKVRGKRYNPGKEEGVLPRFWFQNK